MSRVFRFLPLAMLLVCRLGADSLRKPAPDGRRFLGVKTFDDWATEKGASGSDTTLTSPEIDPQITWNELIVSWNIGSSPTRRLKVEAQAVYPDRSTKWYTMGLWSDDPALNPRESVRKQKDADGDVETDTLVLSKSATRVRLRLSCGGESSQDQSPPRFLGLSFLDRNAVPLDRNPQNRAWGRELNVPQRSQLAYEGGKVWCSPTSTSMVLGYWARKLKTPEWDRDVPAVAKGVFDPQWPGTGNWPFNTAYAGSLPGMRGYVTRLPGLRDLEEWTLKGVPVVCSVSYRLLYGRDNPEAGGHIVVCVGFDRSGDPVIHDPWARLERGDSIRKTIPRKNLAAAWAKSKNTAYLIHPETWRTPPLR